MKFFISFMQSEINIIPTSLKRFRYGADYIISENTDNYSTNVEQIEFWALKYSIRGTIYELASETVVNRDVYTQNVFECSIYWQTDDYFNGSFIKGTPDYTDIIWTPNGVAAYVNAVLGEAKPFRYPNAGTQFHYMTDGKWGSKLDRNFTDWDKGIGYEGIDNPTVDPDNADSNVIANIGTDGDVVGNMDAVLVTSPQGHKTIAYRVGQEGSWQEYGLNLIGGRNSSSSDLGASEWLDEWDITKRAELSMPSTTRYDNGDGSGAAVIQNYRDELEAKTIPDKGWYNNFTHWHSGVNLASMEDFYIMLQNVSDVNSELCWFAGMSEAMEYRWFANIITNISAVQHSSIVNVVVTIDNVWSLPLSHIVTPVSVEVDLSQTNLSGKDIVSNVGRIKSLGSDIYIVDVFADSLQTVLSEGTADYIDLSYPVISGESFVTDTLTIDTDMLTVATLFSDQIGKVVERKLSNAIEHIFTGLSSSTTYYLGIMSRENKSIMQTINT